MAEGVDAEQLLYARPMHRQGRTRYWLEAAQLFCDVVDAVPEEVCVVPGTALALTDAAMPSADP
jgi:hypothetical protein